MKAPHNDRRTRICVATVCVSHLQDESDVLICVFDYIEYLLKSEYLLHAFCMLEYICVCVCVCVWVRFLFFATQHFN